MSIDTLAASGAVLPEDPARLRTLAQLEAVTKFMTVHPSFPVSGVTIGANGAAIIYKRCESAAEVDWIARTVGIGAKWRAGGQYVASMRIGPALYPDLYYEVAYIAPPSPLPAPVVTEDEGSDERELAKVA